MSTNGPTPVFAFQLLSVVQRDLMRIGTGPTGICAEIGAGERAKAAYTCINRWSCSLWQAVGVSGNNHSRSQPDREGCRKHDLHFDQSYYVAPSTSQSSYGRICNSTKTLTIKT